MSENILFNGMDENGYFPCVGCGKYIGFWTAIHDDNNIHKTVGYTHGKGKDEVDCDYGVGFDFMKELKKL